MKSSQQRQTRLQDISAHKAICSQLETLEKRAIILFFNLPFTHVFMTTFHYIVDACVDLMKEFLNLTINMQLLYFITRARKRAG